MRALGKWFAVLLLAGMAGTVGAAKKADYSAIHRLTVDVLLGQDSVELANGPAAAFAAGLQTKKSLESHIGAALAAAKKKPDLLKATKELYVAATSYFENAAPTSLIDAANSKHAKATMDEKRTALELELKLVE